MGNNIRKVNIYLPEEMAEEILNECRRLDRSITWIMRKVWKTARKTIGEFPSYPLSSTTENMPPEKDKTV